MISFTKEQIKARGFLIVTIEEGRGPDGLATQGRMQQLNVNRAIRMADGQYAFVNHETSPVVKSGEHLAWVEACYAASLPFEKVEDEDCVNLHNSVNRLAAFTGRDRNHILAILPAPIPN